ncbi:MAG: DUF1513 domain-containing protein [Saccharospirillaceae bacterium]|nr:DUF1513 domain-containing protein [Saccharospirillaceae bacterium]
MQKINRRQFIQTSALGLSASVSLCGGIYSARTESERSATVNTTSQRLLVSGYRDHATQSIFGVLISDTEGNLISDITVDDRVHMADLFPHHASPAVLVNSREPDAPLKKYSTSGELLAHLMPPENMHYEGHSVFSADGRFIYSTASHYVEKTGYVLEIHAADLTLKRIIATDGIGPHELIIDGDQLYIANTGVLTHPNSGRDPLNISTMKSELVQIDIPTGAIKQRWKSPIQALSARHLTQMPDGSVLVGCQYQKQDDRPATVALARDGESQLQLLQPENEHYYWDMKGYTASLRAFPKSSAYAGAALISNPRGHLLSHWQPQQAIKPGVQTLEFSKGIVLGDSEGWISAGAGELWHWQATNQELTKITAAIKSNFWWENHLHSRVLRLSNT